MAKKQHIINEYHLNRNQPDRPQFTFFDLNNYVKKNIADTTRPHIHSYYQVIWFKGGVGRHFVDFKEYKVSRDTVFFITKNQVHYFDEKTHYQGVMIHFNETFLIQNDSETDFFLKHNLLNNSFQQPSCRIDPAANEILETYIRQIAKEVDSKETFGKEEILRSYLKSFLIQIQRAKKTVKSISDGTVSHGKRMQLVKFVNLVDENYNKGLAAFEYARILNISSRTLSDLTKEMLNKTPLRIVRERIILEAQRLLLHSDLNISQIGYRLGFDDPSYFVKYFKKHVASSPSDFRKSIIR